MSNKKEKKIAFVCFCVDGDTDITALKAPFDEMFDKIGGNNIKVEFRTLNLTGGDITSEEKVNVENIEEKIRDHYFLQKDQNSGLGWKDLTYIIHIIDLDGAYVNNNNVKPFTKAEGEEALKLSSKDKEKTVLYKEDHIAVKENTDKGQPRVELIKARNKQKMSIIGKLRGLNVLTFGDNSRKTEKDKQREKKEEKKEGKKKGRQVKYKLFYFSSNLDHYLYGDANLSVADKVRQSVDFQSFYWNDDLLKDFFEQSKYSIKRSYKEESWESCYERSWDLLWKEKKRSLARGTNVNLLIEMILNSKFEDWL